MSNPRAEHYTWRKDKIGEWSLGVVTYRFDGTWYCEVDNFDPGARLARRQGATREEAENAALVRAAELLERTRTHDTG